MLLWWEMPSSAQRRPSWATVLGGAGWNRGLVSGCEISAEKRGEERCPRLKTLSSKQEVLTAITKAWRWSSWRLEKGTCRGEDGEGIHFGEA